MNEDEQKQEISNETIDEKLWEEIVDSDEKSETNINVRKTLSDSMFLNLKYERGKLMIK